MTDNDQKRTILDLPTLCICNKQLFHPTSHLESLEFYPSISSSVSSETHFNKNDIKKKRPY